SRHACRATEKVQEQGIARAGAEHDAGDGRRPSLPSRQCVRHAPPARLRRRAPGAHSRSREEYIISGCLLKQETAWSFENSILEAWIPGRQASRNGARLRRFQGEAADLPARESGPFSVAAGCKPR